MDKKDSQLIFLWNSWNPLALKPDGFYFYSVILRRIRISNE